MYLRSEISVPDRRTSIAQQGTGCKCVLRRSTGCGERGAVVYFLFAIDHLHWETAGETGAKYWRCSGRLVKACLGRVRQCRQRAGAGYYLCCGDHLQR